MEQATKHSGDPKLANFLGLMYSRWVLWYEWFFKSQENPSLPYTFSWRGRTSDENMPSGLDDYPRAFHVNEGYEIHLDLQSWMVEFSQFMSTFAGQVGDSRRATTYANNAIAIKDQLQSKLYNANAGIYCDYVGL
jgi:mannosyl-oligosaccharide glucosidase